MPHMAGFQLKGTQISGGHISTTATGPDGKKSSVEMFSASQYEKPDVPHSVVTAQDGSQWYQMASGEGRGAFYDAPDFGSAGAGTDPVADNPSGGAADVPADSDVGAGEMGADTSVQPVTADVSEVAPAPVADGGTGDAVPVTGDALPDGMPEVPADTVPGEALPSDGSIPAETGAVPAIPSTDTAIAADAPAAPAEGDIPGADTSETDAVPGEGVVPAAAGAIPAIPEGETDALPIAPGDSDAAEPIGEAGMVPGDNTVPEGSIPAEIPAGDASAITSDEAPVDGEIPAGPAVPEHENPIVAAAPPVVPIGGGEAAVSAEGTAESEGTGHSIAPTDISDSVAPSVPAGESVVAFDAAPDLPLNSDVPPDSSGAESDTDPAPGIVLPGAVPSDGIGPTVGGADQHTPEADNPLSGLSASLIPGSPETLDDLPTGNGEMQAGTASEGERLMASDTPTPISTDTPRSPESIPTADHPEPADVHSEDVPAVVMPDGESLAAADAPAGIPTGTDVPAVSGDPVSDEAISGDAPIAAAGDHSIGAVPADRDVTDVSGIVPAAPAGDVPTIPQTEVGGTTAPGATIPGSVPGEATIGTVPPASSEGIRGGSVISDASGSGEHVGAVPHGADSPVLHSGISGVHDTHPVVGSNGSDMIPKAPDSSVSREKTAESGAIASPTMMPIDEPGAQKLTDPSGDGSSFRPVTAPPVGGTVKQTMKTGESGAVTAKGQIPMGMGTTAASVASAVGRSEQGVMPSDGYPGTMEPMGTIANKQLRRMRKEAHHYFDQLHARKIMSRKEAYLWLSDMLGLPVDQTHIGLMGEYNCQRVITESQKMLEGHPMKKRNKRKVMMEGDRTYESHITAEADR